jgi:hypothetical protein
MSGEVLSDSITEIRALLDQRLHIRGRSLQEQMRKASRRLPRAVRRDALAVANAETMMGYPKLSRMVNAGEVQKSGARVVAYLKTIDPRERRKGAFLSLLGKISAVLIAAFILAVWYLAKTGQV